MHCKSLIKLTTWSEIAVPMFHSVFRLQVLIHFLVDCLEVSLAVVLVLAVVVDSLVYCLEVSLAVPVVLDLRVVRLVGDSLVMFLAEEVDSLMVFLAEIAVGSSAVL